MHFSNSEQNIFAYKIIQSTGATLASEDIDKVNTNVQMVLCDLQVMYLGYLVAHTCDIDPQCCTELMYSVAAKFQASQLK